MNGSIYISGNGAKSRNRPRPSSQLSDRKSNKSGKSWPRGETDDEESESSQVNESRFASVFRFLGRSTIARESHEAHPSSMRASKFSGKASMRSAMTLTTLLCPEEAAAISFHEYTFKSKDKVILDNVSGTFRAGKLTAVMGPSGSGKTSLIETLTGSSLGVSKNAITATRLTLNGQQCTREDIAAISGFVPQDDMYVATMKVREAVAMSANLRLPRHVTQEEREVRIEEALEILNLTHCANTQIGGVFSRGISGGETRRVSISRELIANPPVIFLDEPTTGLDSFTALTVIRKLKTLASQGRTIVVTIHQPSSDIFKLFDDVALLIGGKVAYWGPAARVLPYFKKRGFECPEFANPSDFLFMEVLRPYDIPALNKDEDIDGHTSLAAIRVGKVVSMWQESSEHLTLVSKTMNTDPSKYPKATPLMSKASFMKQFTYLYAQYFKTSLRSPLSLPLRVVFAVYSGLMIGLTYTTLRSDDFLDQIRGKTGAISFMMSCMFIAGFLGCIQVMWEDRTVFLRDYRSHYYDVTPAYIAKMMVALPVDFFGAVLSVLIAYYMIGLNPAFSACLFLAVVAGVVQVIGVLAGSVVGYSVADARRLVASSIIFLLPFLIFGGIFIAPMNIPGYLRWLVYLDPIYYSFTAGMQVGFTPCPDAQSASESNPVFPCQRTVAFEAYGIEDALPAGVNFTLLTTLAIVLFVLGWLSLALNCTLPDQSALSVLISYYMIGLDPEYSSFLFVAAVAAMTEIIGVLTGFVIGYSFADARNLVASAAVFLLTFSIYGGTFIVPRNIPGYLRWMIYLDPIYYAFTSSMQIGYNRCFDASSASKNNPVFPCQRTVAFEVYGINDALPAGVNFALLTKLAFVLCFLGWVSLSLNCKYRSK